MAPHVNKVVKEETKVSQSETSKLNPKATVYEPKPGHSHVTIGSIQLADSSLYLSGKVNDQPTSMLLDTGAAVTLISSDEWDRLDSTKKTLEPAIGSLMSATKENLQIMGIVEAELQIGTRVYCHPVVVVKKLSHPCLLGSDFFAKHHCTIRYESATLEVGDEEIPLRRQSDEPKICRVILGKSLKIPAQTEMIVPGKLARGGESSHLTPGMIEKKKGPTPFTTGRTLVKSNHGKLPIRVANFTDKPIRMRTNQTLGWFHPVTEISGHKDNKHVDAKENGEAQEHLAAAELAATNAGTPCTPDPVPSPVLKQECMGAASIAATSSGTPCTPDPVQSPMLQERIQKLLEKLEIDQIDLTGQQRAKLIALIEEYQDIFSMEDLDIGHTTVVEHRIETGDAVPIKQRPRRVPPHQQRFVDETTRDLLKKNLIKESTGPWSSPIVLARKHDGSFRLCVDYRKLNECTVKSAQPLPRIDDTLGGLAGSCWFSSLDCASGYWQVGVAPEDREKTGFVSGVKQYEWLAMPFGLTGAPATFTRLMNIVLGGVEYCLVYLDDIIVHTPSFDQHILQLREVFERLRRANMKLKPAKCKLLRPSLKWLGHVVSKDGIATDPEKICQVQEWPIPKDVGEVRSFMGLAVYYQKYVKDYSEVAAPLHQLTGKNATFEWTEACARSFSQLKQALVEAPVLAYPDFSADAGPFILDTDASDYAVGAVLSQRQKDGSEKVIAYGSKSLQGGESNYCTTRREMLALVKFAKHFRYFLLGKKFLVRVDNMALRWLLNFKDPSGQVARWLESLAEFDFDIEHRAGRHHGNADALSRRPSRIRQHGDCPSCGPTDKDKQTQSVNLINVKTKWSTEEFAKAQMDDPDIRPVYQHLKAGQKDVPQRLLQGCSAATRAIWAQRELLEMKDDAMYFKSPDNPERKRMLMPESFTKLVIAEAHEGFAGGHLGMRKTYAKVKARVWRPGLKRLVEEFVRTCCKCQKCKSLPKATRAPLQSIPVGRRNQRLHIDFVGPINPPSRRGNRYIMVMEDAFTKWPEAWAMKTQRTSACAQVIVNEYVSRFGAPESMHSDQGANFESKVFKEMCTLLGIEKTRTTAYHPQGNGQVENLNKSLKKMLTTLVDDNCRDWDEKLPSALMAYRSSVQESTGETPFAMMFGAEMQIPLDLMLGTGDEKTAEKTNYVADLRDKIESTHRQVRESIKLAQKRQRVNYDCRMKDASFKEGDEVLLRNHHVKPGEVSKFHQPWKGPYLVTQKISEVNYRIVDRGKRNGKAKVVHLNNIKPFHSRADGEETDTKKATAKRKAVKAPLVRKEPADDAREDILVAESEDSNIDSDSEEESVIADVEQPSTTSDPGRKQPLERDAMEDALVLHHETPEMQSPAMEIVDMNTPAREARLEVPDVLDTVSGSNGDVLNDHEISSDSDVNPFDPSEEVPTNTYQLRPRTNISKPVRYQDSVCVCACSVNR